MSCWILTWENIEFFVDYSTEIWFLQWTKFEHVLFSMERTAMDAMSPEMALPGKLPWQWNCALLSGILRFLRKRVKNISYMGNIVPEIVLERFG